MKVLIVGSGGREHALAWKVAQSGRVEQVIVAPGNGGTATMRKCRNANVQVDDIYGLLQLAEREDVSFTLIGPEAPLVDGIVDRFEAADMPCFGPSAEAAQLEGSKAFAKHFMQRHGIPTANWAEFEQTGPALDYLASQSYPVVIKASGLAAGKGVIIAENPQQAEQAVRSMLEDRDYGSAGTAIVIEEYLSGEEASFIVMADGTEFIEFATSQDHKRALDGDRGPNTGGMGAYSPAPVVTPRVRQQVLEQVIKPTLEGMRTDGISYTGFLYAGLMIDDQGHAKVLEYNCRLGDPETQPLMLRLQTDLVDLIEAALQHRLASVHANWHNKPALGVVMTAAGYPDKYPKGLAISGKLHSTLECAVFHSGTRLVAGELLSSGGRVLCVTALGHDLQQARDQAYQRIDEISFDHACYRKDIGHRALSG
ncbi:MAG: phosphoribosylamine--glycine ligase [Gammaproteobacteria bacterium]|jgi:phosphoribosylamine--glycine ligase|nr:phosphoribosylamine--glycine ligase [Gammaproteobacteria bacterium]